MIFTLFNFLEYICKCTGIAILLYIVLYNFVYFLIQKRKTKEEEERKKSYEQQSQNIPGTSKSHRLKYSYIPSWENYLSERAKIYDELYGNKKGNLNVYMQQLDLDILECRKKLQTLDMEERQTIQNQNLISSMCSDESVCFYADNIYYQIRK